MTDPFASATPTPVSVPIAPDFDTFRTRTPTVWEGRSSRVTFLTNDAAQGRRIDGAVWVL